MVETNNQVKQSLFLVQVKNVDQDDVLGKRGRIFIPEQEVKKESTWKHIMCIADTQTDCFNLFVCRLEKLHCRINRREWRESEERASWRRRIRKKGLLPKSIKSPSNSLNRLWASSNDSFDVRKMRCFCNVTCRFF